MDASSQIVYDERRLALLAVKYKEGIQRFTQDDVMAWAH